MGDGGAAVCREPGKADAAKRTPPQACGSGKAWGRTVTWPPRRLSVWACSVTQSCPTLCNSMGSSPPGSSVHGILQSGILEWVAISYFLTQESNSHLLRLLHCQADSLPSHHLGS